MGETLPNAIDHTNLYRRQKKTWLFKRWYCSLPGVIAAASVAASSMLISFGLSNMLGSPSILLLAIPVSAIAAFSTYLGWTALRLQGMSIVQFCLVNLMYFYLPARMTNFSRDKEVDEYTLDVILWHPKERSWVAAHKKALTR